MASPENMSQADQQLLGGQSAPAPASAMPSPVAPTPSSISTPAPQPSASPATPAAGQASATPGTTTTPATPAPAASGQAEPTVSDEQLLAAAGLAETPEKKLGRIEREYSASSKEARRLSEYAKRVKDALEEQGITITEDEQKLPTGLFATKKYSKEMGELNVKFADLPEDKQKLFDSEPQKAIDFLVEKARKAFTKIVPNTDQMPVNSISPERQETAIAYLNDAKWETGDVRFPGLQANRKLIDQMINAPTTPKTVRDFCNQEPELAYSLFHLQLEHARSHIKEQALKIAAAAKTKADAANANPTPAPTGGGTPTLGNPQSSGNPYVDSMNQAMDEISRERARPKQ